MDSRLKFQYYEDNKWESYYIRQAKIIVTEIWESKYKNNVDISQSSDNLEDELLLHIFKRRKTDNKDELKAYLREPTVAIKTDILLWWKVNFIINYILYNNI